MWSMVKLDVGAMKKYLLLVGVCMFKKKSLMIASGTVHNSNSDTTKERDEDTDTVTTWYIYVAVAAQYFYTC